MIDGFDITKVDLKALRSQLMVVTQETVLFEGSLLENLIPQNTTQNSAREIEDLLEEIGFCHKDYIQNKTAMRIDNNGSNLSAGEKQLICFARCVVENTKLIILDEATASIDVKTEEMIQKCIEKYFKASTMLIVAHRIQTLLECDRILVLDAGKVAELGTPEELLRKDSFFKQIVEKMKAGEIE